MTSTPPVRATYAQPGATHFLEKLSDWDSPSDPLAPLTPEQKDSYLELASIAGNRPLPIELPLDEPVNQQRNMPAKTVYVTGSVEDILSQGFSDLDMGREKIQDVQQFYAWFNKVEDKMAKLEAESYMEHVETLTKYKSHCTNVISDVDLALKSLNELEKEYVFVSTKTNALHDACEQLLADQTKLINTAESIQHDLAYFNELERITTKLHSPSLAVTGESFQALLTKIDECIEFMAKHITYKDSTEYLGKFKACLSNALTMIKNYVVKSLNDTTRTILNRKTTTTSLSSNTETLGTENSGNSVQEDAFTLYYGKFRTNAPRIKGLVEQIERRIEKNEEYHNFLSEIHQCYFSQRELLVGPSVTAAMSDLLTANKQDHCALVRSGCAFMVHVCEDEHQLFSHFFTLPSIHLDEMLRRLCVSLYDMLRPLIIHVYHLETLAELCTILKTDMIDDHVQNNPEQLRAFAFVAKQMLEDVQERLVFRTNIHIRDDILGYKPAPGDLAYPEKLEMMEEIAQSLKEAAIKEENEKSFTEIKLDDSSQEQPGSSGQMNTTVSGTEASSMETSMKSGMLKQQRFQTSPADMHGMWFPTVRRVLICLSKLYRCIDKTIFQGLSQEALQACVESLVRASRAIKTQEFAVKKNEQGQVLKAPKPKVIDAQLFLIKHLLILREQIAPFQAEFAIRETQLDFTRTKDVAYQMLELKTLPKLLRVNSNNAILQFFMEGAPEVKEFYIDSKKDVDRQLKIACEDFIDYVTKVLIGGLGDFLEKAKLVLNVTSEEGGPKASLRQQAFATPEILKEIISNAYRDLKKTSRNIHTSLSLYLANRETENILFKPVKLNVQQAYQQLQMILLENYTEDDRAIVAAPSPEQISILLTALRK